MAYPKWRLGQSDRFQTLTAAREAARMLHDWANDVPGTFALACEAVGVDDWDDVVAFSCHGPQIKARHVQVKRQYGDFGAKDDFLSLFRHAQNVLAQPNPYDGITVPPRNRSFLLVFPVDCQVVELSRSKSLLIADLRKLCSASNDTSVDTIGVNRGGNLPPGQRIWLETVADAFSGDFVVAASVIARVEIHAISEDQACLEVQGLMNAAFEHGNSAVGLLEKLLREVVPEGRLHVDDLLRGLEDARAKRLVRPIHLGARGDDIVVEGLSDPGFGVDSAAGEIVQIAWGRNEHRELRISFCPQGAMGARAQSSFARLLLHATSRPTRVSGLPQWYADLLRLTASTTGGNESQQVGLEFPSYCDAVRKESPIQKGLCSKLEMASALATAMDKYVLSAVDACCDSRAATETEIADGLRHVRAAFNDRRQQMQRMLRGWWEDSSVDGLVRAGPCATERIASVYLALAVLWSTERPLRDAKEVHGWAIAELGDIEVRALAMERYSRSNEDDGAPCRCDAEEVADRLLGPAALVFMSHGNEVLIPAFASSAKLASMGEHSFQEATCPTVVVNAADFVKRAKLDGLVRARELLEQRTSRLARHNRALWNAAVEDWRDSDVSR